MVYTPRFCRPSRFPLDAETANIWPTHSRTGICVQQQSLPRLRKIQIPDPRSQMPVPRGEGNSGWARLPLPHFLPFSSRRAAIIGWGCGGVLDPRTILAHPTAITRTGRQKNKRFNTLPLTTTNFQGSSLSRGSRPSIPLTSATRPEQGLGRRCDLPYEKDKLLYMQALSRHVGQGRTDSLEPPSGTHATPRSGPTQATPVRPIPP